jgi:hypothetical protein
MSAGAGVPRPGPSSSRRPDRLGSPPVRQPRGPQVRGRRAGRNGTTGRLSATPQRLDRIEHRRPRGRSSTLSRSAKGTSVAGSGPQGASGRPPRPPRPARPSPATLVRGRRPPPRWRRNHGAPFGSTTPADPGVARAHGLPPRKPSGAGRPPGPGPASGPLGLRGGGADQGAINRPLSAIKTRWAGCRRACFGGVAPGSPAPRRFSWVDINLGGRRRWVGRAGPRCPPAGGRRPTAGPSGDRRRGTRRLPRSRTSPGGVGRPRGGEVPVPPVGLGLSYRGG